PRRSQPGSLLAWAPCASETGVTIHGMAGGQQQQSAQVFSRISLEIGWRAHLNIRIVPDMFSVADQSLPEDPALLADEIARVAAHLDAATHRLLGCIRRFDESGEWGRQGAISCAHWLSWRIGLDLGTAREKVRVARALGALPRMDETLRGGRLSYAKVRAMTRVATAENEDRLLEIALACTGGQLERVCR